MWHHLLRSLAVTAIAFAVVACGGGGSPEDSAAVRASNASSVLPYGTLTDWVSYGQQVSVVTVLSEQEISPEAEVLERGEGYIGRSVELAIGETIWTAPGVARIEGTIEVRDWGWTLRDGERIPIMPRMEPGKQYLAPLAEIEGSLTPMNVIAIELVGGAVPAELPLEYTFAEGLHGATLDGLRAILADTAPDPVVEPYMHLDPVARYAARSGSLPAPTN